MLPKAFSFPEQPILNQSSMNSSKWLSWRLSVAASVSMPPTQGGRWQGASQAGILTLRPGVSSIHSRERVLFPRLLGHGGHMSALSWLS